MAYLGHERGLQYGVNNDLLESPVQGGDATSVFGDFAYDLGNAANSDARDPFAPAAPRYTARWRGILALVSRSGCVEVVKFGRDGGHPKSSSAGPEREVAAFSAPRDEGRLVALISDPTHPYEVVRAGRRHGAPPDA